MATTVDKERFENLIGKEVGVSDWFRIDQDRVNAFADATLDHQYIHVDEARAAATPFGGTIAHGFLTLSLLSRLAGRMNIVPGKVVMGVNYGLNKVRFIAPVRTGSEIRARVVLKDSVSKGPGRILNTLGVTVEIKGEEKPAAVADWLVMAVVE